MKILSIDTATEVCSVAVLENKEVILEKTLESVNTHSVSLMPLIKDVLSESNLSLNDIDLFACDKGPGSFTGIRIGLSTVKAFCDVTNKPCVGVTSLEGFAYKLFDILDTDEQCSPLQYFINNKYSPLQEYYICSLLNANHGNVYCGIFYFEDEKLTQMQDYRFDPLDNILKFVNTLEKNIFFVGNCGKLLLDVIKSNKLLQGTVVSCLTGIPANGAPTSIYDVSYSKMKNIVFDTNITGKDIGRCAFDKFNAGDYGYSDFLTPLYLKQSSAESKGTD